ncbi:methyltransferase domain-containing protein [Rhodocytophaga rosea]|uniref:Methyltransferase domain-containing protein n=1 Tax=Rhodocytophaga rosea TaxID=2704465 RepID=A0A6C0GLD9_9BACT|nr:methyltransferase [Rhodocytophaga rosea]QHT68634.1 methyltransferase domain-containing protein [Rhodocytophaga rosea]
METSLLDLAPITRHLRAMASSQLLIAGVHHFHMFEHLQKEPCSIEELQAKLGLKERPAMVLFPALCAMQLLNFNTENKLYITEMGKHLIESTQPNLISYIGLEKDNAGVLEMTQLLKNDGPLDESALTYVKEGDTPSVMDEEETARFFTLALAGRAQYLSPIVASKLPQKKAYLLDVGAGTGFYTYEWLLANPEATATIFDRPAVLAVAKEFLDTFSKSNRKGAAGVKERISFQAGDMLIDELPQADILLAASVFHDWPTETCMVLAKRFADVIRPGGELWVHDAFLNDNLDGPLAVTDYSGMLFMHTKGRAYSRKEYRNWFSQAGLTPTSENIPTLLDYGLISASKSAL